MLVTRRFALQLLAPTVLVSLILVGACVFGTIYLNNLHLNASAVLTENRRSLEAAYRLETTTRELLRLLRSDHTNPPLLGEQIRKQNENARELLVEAESLANLERESILVHQIAQGLKEYLANWDQRSHVTGERLRDFDTDLAEGLVQSVLTPCTELHSFNTAQVEQSDQENRQLVERLKWGMLAVGLGAPLGGLMLGYAVARSLHRSIYQLSVHIRDAAGRLKRELGSVTLKEVGDFPDLHRQMQGIIEEIGRVIDQLEQREREVVRAEQLAAVGQIAAGVAHELRNPLTSIKMLVQVAREGNPPAGLPAEDLRVLEQQARRMEQTIQTFLDFARPPRTEQRRADMTEAVRRAITLVEGRARRQKVVVDAVLPGEPVHLKIDVEQVHQVLVNLLINALDALPRGGTVRVEVETSDRGVSVTVRDSGSGIAARIRPRLFEPFVSSKENGLGLGLSICKRLIEAHGGTICGQDDDHGGAAFTFTLPLGEEAHAHVASR
jgi:two-component system, NtrC family, sensor histidine kinase HydH